MTRMIPFLMLAGMVAEIASIIWVGKALGVIPTVFLLLASGVVGLKLLKLAGTSVVEAFRSPVQSSSVIGSVGGTAMTRVFAGLLFLIPGFFSDTLALLILLPPVQRWVQSRFRVETFSVGGTRATEPFEENRFGKVIDGKAIEIIADGESPPSSGKGNG